MALLSVAAFYLLMSISFFLCIVPLVQHGRYVLHARAQDWAQDINSICIVMALAGVGALMLVVAQNRATELQRKAARSDALTGLLNRRALFEWIGCEGRGRGCAAIMFDLDNFKRINDRFGHATGDEVLTRFAKVMRENVRTGVRRGAARRRGILHIAAEHERARRPRGRRANSKWPSQRPSR